LGSFGLIRLATVFAMLDECAPGHTRRSTRHHWRVNWGGKSYHALPQGGHGERRPEVERGHVRKMARELELPAECVNRHVPGLLSNE